MSYAATVALFAACVAVLTMMALQVLSFVRGRSIITRRHFALRMVSGALLLAILLGIFAGHTIKFPSPWHELAFWAVIVLSTVAVAVLALTDLRLTERQIHLRRAELYSQLGKLEQQLKQLAEKAKRGGNGEHKDHQQGA